jgi:glycine/D-amino acid oxidase-like deaminating enzyme
MTFDVVVIGAGIVGASVAFRLAAAGARVGVACGGRPGGGTSGASLAWFNSANKGPLAYHQLNVAGMAEWRSLAEELEAREWVHLDGGIAWEEGEEETTGCAGVPSGRRPTAQGAVPPTAVGGQGSAVSHGSPGAGRAALQAQVARLRRWGYAVEVLTVAQARRYWAPDLCLDPERVREVVCMPDEGWVSAVPLIHRLLEHAARRGAAVEPEARVAAVLREGDRVTGVRTVAGEQWSAGMVVNCAGPQADVVARMAGVTLPLRREPGMLVVTEPVPACLRPVVHSPAGTFRPDGGGRVLILTDLVSPAEPIEAAMPSVPAPAAAAELVERVAAYLPALCGARLEAARVGVRPMPEDGHPIVGPAPGLEGFYVVVTHSGITLGPLLGRLVGGELLGGTPEPRLAPYRPARFAPVSPSDGAATVGR